MKLNVIFASATVAVSVFADAAVAHEMDTDQDGLYTLAEMRTEYPDLTEADYAALDTNEDEALDVEELEAAWADGRLEQMDD